MRAEQWPSQAEQHEPHPNPQGAHRNISESLVFGFRPPFFLPFCPVTGWVSRVKAEWGLARHCMSTVDNWHPCSTGDSKAQGLELTQNKSPDFMLPNNLYPTKVLWVPREVTPTTGCL